MYNMHSVVNKGSGSRTSSIDVKGAKAMFENGMRRQRAPSPAPKSLTAQNGKKAASLSNISSYKERFEQFTAPKNKATPNSTLRRTVSEDNVAKSTGTEEVADRGRARSNSAAEGHWFQARTKIYEQLSKQRSQSSKDVKQNFTKATGTSEPKRASSVGPFLDGQLETASISERINKYKSDVETKKTTSEKIAEQKKEKPGINVKDMKSTFTASEINNAANLIKSTTFLEKCKKLGQSIKGEPPPKSKFTETETKTSPQPKKIVKQEAVTKFPSEAVKQDNTHPQHKPDNRIRTSSRDQQEGVNKSINSQHQHNQKKIIVDVTDATTARKFMDELIAAIDNEQHVPMRQLIDLFETMKKENGEMRDSLAHLRLQLGKEDLDTISNSLERKLADTSEELERTKEQIQELSAYREALRESEERCEELEELNNQYLEEIEELKLVMNEMRDQFHDDEVHETIILQQRLDDMARSLRIIHFRLKKADTKLQETEREKEILLEEIKLLQGGTFTDEEIRRMQSLEGDLQSAKDISMQLHNQLQQSEQRREKLEKESNQLRDEIKAGDLENERLRNNILHLRDQIGNHGNGSQSLTPAVNLVRQGSSADMETLKSNLEASIERENDIKEQLSFAEEEAKMLRKRLRDVEHENEALTKQLKKLTQATVHRGDKSGSSEHIQTEVIQLENVELRRKNDSLHQDIDSLQTQIKSLRQKLALVHDEQNEGPLSVMKNSLYYETKFEKMMQEINDLRQQLQERDADLKNTREQLNGKTRRDQFRRAITIDGDSVDLRKQLDIAHHEADLLKERLQQVERASELLTAENTELRSASKGTNPSTSKISLPHGSSSTPALSGLIHHIERDRLSELQQENSKLVTELSYYRKSRPDIAELVHKVHESEQKINSYESQISHLRNDMQRMERNLQDDINSLTMKNTILRQLLEVISEHDGEEKSSSSVETTSPHQRRSSTFRNTANSQLRKSSDSAGSDMSNDSIIAKHINRLPHDIQQQFKRKIELLENELKEERERSRTAESLLQQVKSSTSGHKRDSNPNHSFG